MHPSSVDLNGKAFLGCQCLHLADGHRLHVIGSDMHALLAATFLVMEELHLGEVLLLFLRGGLHGPVEILLRHEIGKADHRDEMEVLLAAVIHLALPRPPEALEGRNDKIEVTLNPPVTHLLILRVKANP